MMKRFFPVILFFVSGSLCIVSCKTTAQTKTSYNLVTDFGANGDGKTNNYAAFQRAAEVLSGTKNKVLIIPAGTYYIADYKVSGGIRKNNITDVRFRDMDGLIVEGNNSTIKINGQFKRSADYKQAGVPFDYAYNNTVSPLCFSNCKNVQVKNLQLEGGANNMERTTGVVEGICYGIMILDETASQRSENISIENVRIKYFATDALYISSNGKNIKVNNSLFLKNARQGISIVKGKDIFITNSRFDSTGFTGKYGSHSPAAGIDVENENSSSELDNIKIVNCSFRHNTGFQFVSTAHSGRVVIDSCYFEDLKKGYGDGFNSVGLYSKNSVLSNSVIYGMLQLETANETYKGTVPQSIKNNIIYSGMGAMLSTDYGTPMDITGNIIVMLPGPVADQFFPFIRNANANFSANIIVTHADKFSKQPSRVFGLVQYVKAAENNWWLLSETSGKKISRSGQSRKDYYAIAYDGTKKIGKQFFPDNSRALVAKTSEKQFLADNVIDQVFSKSIFTKYDQYKYDRSLILEASQIRDLLSRYSK